MKIKKRYWLLLFVILFGLIKIDIPISYKSAAGTYINTNYENSAAAETPLVPDTMILSPDGVFYSKYYGNGLYELRQNGLVTKINFVYGEKPYQGYFETSFSNKIYESKKIILFRDLNHHYKKID
jgi:hypothetical protein